jgi:hypothetical protein
MSGNVRVARRAIVLLSIVVALVAWPRLVVAEAESVPIGLQVELLARVASYDRKLPERSGGRVRVAIVTKADNADSERASVQLKKALGATPTIGGLPHEELVINYTSADALATACRSEHLSVVYFTPGFGSDVADIRRALDGVSVISVSTVAADVSGGIVLGFDLVAAKPKLLFHLTQARRQNVSISPEIMHLMKVYE